MGKILVTGANGFIGRAIVDALKVQGHDVLSVCRSIQSGLTSNNEIQMDLTFDRDDWSELLEGVRVIIHTAARVHVMNDDMDDPLTSYRKVNTAATLNLAKHAAIIGVKRFIFISTIKVNGEYTHPGHAFREQLESIPTDPYAVSKWEAEQGLMQLARETDMEVVIVRPPLVYGPGVKGNFAAMVKLIKKGVPLPLGAVHNRRSILALDNLVSFILLCLKHPKAANQTFVLSDGKDFSTTELLCHIARAVNKKAKLIPVPVGWMAFIARLIRKRAIADRLFNSLQVDISKANQLLGWHPVTSMDEQLAKMLDP